MRLGIVSDIHCNAAGLDAALGAMGEIDELLCLGDSIFQDEFSNEVVAVLRDRGAHIIHGNHEETFFSAAGAAARADPRIDAELLAFLAAQPARRTVTMGGVRILMVHSTPWDPRGEYVYPHSKQLRRFGDVEADVLLYGHTHTQLIRRIGTVLVINPGSAGNAQDPGNGRRLSCAVLDTSDVSAQVFNYADPGRSGRA